MVPCPRPETPARRQGGLDQNGHARPDGGLCCGESGDRGTAGVAVRASHSRLEEVVMCGKVRRPGLDGCRPSRHPIAASRPRAGHKNLFTRSTLQRPWENDFNTLRLRPEPRPRRCTRNEMMLARSREPFLESHGPVSSRLACHPPL